MFLRPPYFEAYLWATAAGAGRGRSEAGSAGLLRVGRSLPRAHRNAKGSGGGHVRWNFAGARRVGRGIFALPRRAQRDADSHAQHRWAIPELAATPLLVIDGRKWPLRAAEPGWAGCGWEGEEGGFFLDRASHVEAFGETATQAARDTRIPVGPAVWRAVFTDWRPQRPSVAVGYYFGTWRYARPRFGIQLPKVHTVILSLSSDAEKAPHPRPTVVFSARTGVSVRKKLQPEAYCSILPFAHVITVTFAMRMLLAQFSSKGCRLRVHSVRENNGGVTGNVPRENREGSPSYCTKY